MEAALLKDAVALDYLGVIGLSRVLAMVGTEEDIPDIPAALWHAEGLRRKIPDLLVFESSKAIARRRIGEMDDFLDRKSTRLNSSHANISYAVFCLKKKNKNSFLYYSVDTK